MRRSFQILPTFLKTQPEQNTAGNFHNVVKISTPQMFGYISRLGFRFKYFTVSRSYGLSKTDGILDVVITMVIVVRTSPERQISTFPIDSFHNDVMSFEILLGTSLASISCVSKSQKPGGGLERPPAKL